MTELERKRKLEGFAFFLGFAGSIPLSNWLIGNVGTTCIPDGPCLIPVAPGLEAPSGVLTVGLALTLRDLVQRRLGLNWSVAAIAVGALLSASFAPPALVIASTVAFLLSEFADLAVYTPLQRRRFVSAVIASGIVGLIVDSIVFLWVAFGSLDFLGGQVVGKTWLILASLPVLVWLRSRDRRLGILPV
ncbi:VUT family protein [Roseibium marinum]|uniref:Beta-carotene 15,15'-monooxygenase n=1 Tax=Roseibium marinum TaxID=281252 RepID=A0A2S3UY44_9HYPH|nr:VUT family protein [Roseibium marinum]POF32606.1 hypothetical protein CLV41_1028 [Roseibium marinum]